MSSNIADTIKRLPLAERIELVEVLWESIAEEGYQPPLTLEQEVELDRRLEDHRRNPGDVVSWESIKNDIQNRQV